MKNQMDMKSLPKLGSTIREGKGAFTLKELMTGQTTVERKVKKVLKPIDRGIHATFRVGRTKRRAGWEGWY
jgi:hypothetical protein